MIQRCFRDKKIKKKIIQHTKIHDFEHNAFVFIEP